MVTNSAVYMDTSGSMDGDNGRLRDEHWSKVHMIFADMPIRFCSFSDENQFMVHESWSTLSTTQLDGLQPYLFNGNTYLWRRVVDEADEMIAGGMKAKEILLYVVTDGMDNRSPGRYHGFGGMEACIQDLNVKGFAAEFWIVGIGLNPITTGQYQSFADRSGGRFFSLSQSNADDVADEVRNLWNRREGNPQAWKNERRGIVSRFISNNPGTTTLISTLDQAQAQLEKIVFDIGHELISPLGTKADAACKSRESMGRGRHGKWHQWALLTEKTYAAMTPAQIRSLAQEIKRFSGNGAFHLILEGFPLTDSGVTLRGGSSSLPPLARWRDRIGDLVDALVEEGIHIETKKIEILTLTDLREQIVPIPNNPYIVIPPSGDGWWWEHSHPDDEYWNAVPGFPHAPCRPGIIVTPFIDCHRYQNTVRECRWHRDIDPLLDNSETVRCFRQCMENYLQEWEPANPGQPLPPPMEEFSHGMAWGFGRECFTHILEQALYHIGHCYMERKMNTDVVVELTHVGDLIGLIEHPALRCFERCIERMSLNSNPISIRYRYSRVNGF